MDHKQAAEELIARRNEEGHGVWALEAYGTDMPYVVISQKDGEYETYWLYEVCEENEMKLISTFTSRNRAIATMRLLLGEDPIDEEKLNDANRQIALYDDENRKLKKLVWRLLDMLERYEERYGK